MKVEMEPVVCELKYSGAAPLALAAAALATLSIVLVLPWSAPLRASIGLGIVALALRAEAEIRSARALQVDADGTVSVTRSDGRTTQGGLQDGCFVAPWLTIVRWRPAGARFDRTVLITPSMAEPQAGRRLRVRLRHG